jgi:polyhydroxyalkanoate synthesis regulator phasin
MATRRKGSRGQAARRRSRVTAGPEAVVLSRERLQAVLDDAVDRGRLTREDAARLLSELVSHDRRTDERRDGSVGGIAGYDDMTAAQVTECLEDRSVAQLREVREHERRNANRKSVLAAVERKLH